MQVEEKIILDDEDEEEVLEPETGELGLPGQVIKTPHSLVKVPYEYEVWADGVFLRNFELLADTPRSYTFPQPDLEQECPRDHKAFLKRICRQPVIPTNKGTRVERGVDADDELVQLYYLFGYDTKKHQPVFQDNWVEAAATVNRSKVIGLRSLGINAHEINALDLIRYFDAVLAVNMKIWQRRHIVRRTCHYFIEEDGKKHHAWLVGDQWIGPKNVVVDRSESQSFVRALHARGTATRWLEFTRPLIEERVSVRWNMSIVFAAPLIRLLDHRTFVVHHGGKTYDGKSACALLAQTVYGHSKESTISWNIAGTGVTDCFKYVSDVPLTFDELQVVDKDKIKEMGPNFYKMTQETHRIRANRSGLLRSAPAGWKTIIKSTGEMSLLEATGDLGGLANRVIEVHDLFLGNTEAEVKKVGESIYRFFLENQYGTIGVQYLQKLALIANLEPSRISTRLWLQVDKLQHDLAKEVMDDFNLTRRLAIIALGEKLMLHWIFGKSPEEAHKLALEDAVYIFKLISKRMDGREPLWKRGLAKLVEHRTSNPQRYIDLDDPLDRTRAKDGVGGSSSIAGFLQGNEIWFLPEVINRYLSESLNQASASPVWSALKHQGILDAGPTTLQRQKSCAEAGVNRVHCYVVIKDKMLPPIEDLPKIPEELEEKPKRFGPHIPLEDHDPDDPQTQFAAWQATIAENPGAYAGTFESEGVEF